MSGSGLNLEGGRLAALIEGGLHKRGDESTKAATQRNASAAGKHRPGRRESRTHRQRPQRHHGRRKQALRPRPYGRSISKVALIDRGRGQHQETAGNATYSFYSASSPEEEATGNATASSSTLSSSEEEPASNATASLSPLSSSEDDDPLPGMSTSSIPLASSGDNDSLSDVRTPQVDHLRDASHMDEEFQAFHKKTAEEKMASAGDPSVWKYALLNKHVDEMFANVGEFTTKLNTLEHSALKAHDKSRKFTSNLVDFEKGIEKVGPGLDVLRKVFSTEQMAKVEPIKETLDGGKPDES